MRTIIFDVDDVLRNLKAKIVENLNVFYRNSDWGDYDYNNDNIRSFMEWYGAQDSYHMLFDNCVLNDNLVRGINSLQDKHQFELFTLSANNNEKAITITKDFIIKNINIKTGNVIFVDRWFDKVKYVQENITKFGNKEDIFFVDDRLQTIKAFDDRGFNTFWYTKYYDLPVIEKNMEHIDHIPENKGSTYNLLVSLQKFLAEVK